MMQKLCIKRKKNLLAHQAFQKPDDVSAVIYTFLFCCWKIFYFSNTFFLLKTTFSSFNKS